MCNCNSPRQLPSVFHDCNRNRNVFQFSLCCYSRRATFGLSGLHDLHSNESGTTMHSNHYIHFRQLIACCYFVARVFAAQLTQFVQVSTLNQHLPFRETAPVLLPSRLLQRTLSATPIGCNCLAHPVNNKSIHITAKL